MKRFALAFVASLLLCLPAAAQQQVQSQEQVQRVGSSTTQRPKPTPEMQKRGHEVLQMAEAGANGLEGGMRAFALLQVARGYEPSDKKKAAELLESAFASTRNMDDDKSHTKGMLQQQILREMTQLAPESVEQHVAEMSPGPWRNQVLGSLLGYYEKQNQLDKAEQMIYRIGSEQEMPYGAVERVMHALPPENNAEAQQLFAAALASFRNHKHNGNSFSTDDFPGLILKSWKRLPPQMVHEAIDEVLSQYDPANQGDSQQQPFNMSMVSDKGLVAFNSMYQWRLFQLLPVLRQLDPGEADDLVKKSREVQTLLDKYPQGMNSLGDADAEEKGEKGKSHGSMSFSIGGGSGGGRQSGPSPLEMQRMQKIMADAEQHPAEALANAQTLSDPQMKSEAMQGIARAAAKKDEATARSALNKLLELLPQLENEQQRVSALRDAAEVYLLMGDQDGAKKMVERGMKTAGDLFRQDSEGDDPNQALKAYWPSTEAYRGMMRLAARISPVWAVSLLKDLPDNDVKVVAETALAAAWLDVPAGATIVMTSNKKGTNMMMSVDDH